MKRWIAGLSLVAPKHICVQVLQGEIITPSVSKHKCTNPESFDVIPNYTLIIDCTEFFIETPRQDLDAASYAYSNYKGRLTAKYLIGVAPNDAITFISDGYPESTSDKVITRESGVTGEY